MTISWSIPIANERNNVEVFVEPFFDVFPGQLLDAIALQILNLPF
jgi:hypothetical protein